MTSSRWVAAALAVGVSGAPVQAQDRLSGEVSVAANGYPDASRDRELRSRVVAESTLDAGAHFRIELGGFAEGLLARSDGTIKAAIVEVDRASVEFTSSRVDLLVGYTRSVWGRLDETQPSDVVNPLDLSKFFFDSREAARMSVGLARARFHLPKSATLELIAVPRFRKGRFDRLGERTSPFNPLLVPKLRIGVDLPPDDVWKQMQGGARLSATTGRVDWALGGYRGFRPLPVYTLSYQLAGLPVFPVPLLVVKGEYPRFTMVSADFETAFSSWALRGEAVVSDEKAVQARGTPVSASGRSLQVGVGADRTLGGYRVMGELLWRDTWLDTPSLPYDPLTTGPAIFDRRSLSMVGILERRFARDTRLVQTFALYDATARNGMTRGLGAISLREGLWLEGAFGWFLGRRAGFLGPFVNSDFVSLRLSQTF